MATTIIKNCKCEHEAQDKMHGNKQRVCNECAKGCRCTVCGDVKMSTKTTPKQAV